MLKSYNLFWYNNIQYIYCIYPKFVWNGFSIVQKFPIHSAQNRELVILISCLFFNIIIIPSIFIFWSKEFYLSIICRKKIWFSSFQFQKKDDLALVCITNFIFLLNWNLGQFCFLCVTHIILLSILIYKYNIYVHDVLCNYI